MAKAYWIACYREIADTESRLRYSKLAVASMEVLGGRFLAYAGKVTAREDGIAERTVIVEWDSYEQAVAAYDHELYQKAVAEFTDGGVVRDFRIIEGVE